MEKLILMDHYIIKQTISFNHILGLHQAKIIRMLLKYKITIATAAAVTVIAGLAIALGIVLGTPRDGDLIIIGSPASLGTPGAPPGETPTASDPIRVDVCKDVTDPLYVWIYTTTNWTITGNIRTVYVNLVAGGGGGGSSRNASLGGGGGGGGGSVKMCYKINVIGVAWILVEIGEGGMVDEPGGASIITWIDANGIMRSVISWGGGRGGSSAAYPGIQNSGGGGGGGGDLNGTGGNGTSSMDGYNGINVGGIFVSGVESGGNGSRVAGGAATMGMNGTFDGDSFVAGAGGGGGGSMAVRAGTYIGANGGTMKFGHIGGAHYNFGGGGGGGFRGPGAVGGNSANFNTGAGGGGQGSIGSAGRGGSGACSLLFL